MEDWRKVSSILLTILTLLPSGHSHGVALWSMPPEQFHPQYDPQQYQVQHVPNSPPNSIYKGTKAMTGRGKVFIAFLTLAVLTLADEMSGEFHELGKWVSLDWKHKNCPTKEYRSHKRRFPLSPMEESQKLRQPLPSDLATLAKKYGSFTWAMLDYHANRIFTVLLLAASVVPVIGLYLVGGVVYLVGSILDFIWEPNWQ